MNRIIACGALLAAAILPLAPPALAHVTFDPREATADTTLRATLRVPHGCEGSPTTAIRIRIPDGVGAVKPMPKPGWELSTLREPAAQPASAGGHGAPADRVVEVRWSGGSLLDEHYDEFVLRMRLPATPGETLYFPVVQECAEGVHRWIEIPVEGAGEPREPAPAIRLVPRS